MMQNELDEFFTDIFKDKRIDKRAKLFLSSLNSNGSALVTQNCSKYSEKIGSYWMSNNTKCGESEISKALYASCNNNIQG